jgi:hypothetical protein
MTVEAFVPSPVYVIAGTGPYGVTHPYRQGALRLAVWRNGIRTELGPADFTVSPVDAEDNGTVTLSAAAAATHAGGSLFITRDTSPEQGWEGATSRERGLEAQLDWLTQGIQDIDQVIGRSLRAPLGDTTNLELPPAVDRALRTLIFDATGRPTVGTPQTTALLVSAYVQSLLASADPATFLGLIDTDLAGIAATTYANDEAPIRIAGSWQKFLVSAFMRGVLSAANLAAAQAALGVGLVPIVEKVANNSASLDFTEFNPLIYQGYEFRISGLVPVTNNVNLFIRTSTNGGATYDAGATDYSYAFWQSEHVNTVGVHTSGGSAGEVAIAVLSGGIASGLSGLSGEVSLPYPHEARPAALSFRGMYVAGAGGNPVRSFHGTGRRSASADVDAIRFLFGSGNIASGRITMYGLRRP